jgi:hypothetical protein
VIAQSRTFAIDLGIDVLQSRDFDILRGKHVGLVTNQTGVDSSGTKTRLILKKALGQNLVALFSPEHGLEGTAPAWRIRRLPQGLGDRSECLLASRPHPQADSDDAQGDRHAGVRHAGHWRPQLHLRLNDGEVHGGSR